MSYRTTTSIKHPDGTTVTTVTETVPDPAELEVVDTSGPCPLSCRPPALPLSPRRQAC